MLLPLETVPNHPKSQFLHNVALIYLITDSQPIVAMFPLCLQVVCNMSGAGQVVLVNPCEPEPMLLTLKSASQNRCNSPTQEKGEDNFTLVTC